MFQSKSSILLLVATIVSSSFLFVHGDILDILQSNIDDIVEVLDQQTRSSAQNRDQNVSGNYNDTKCREDIRVLMKALNNTEMWAIKGESNIHSFICEVKLRRRRERELRIPLDGRGWEKLRFREIAFITVRLGPVSNCPTYVERSVFTKKNEKRNRCDCFSLSSGQSFILFEIIECERASTKYSPVWVFPLICWNQIRNCDQSQFVWKNRVLFLADIRRNSLPIDGDDKMIVSVRSYQNRVYSKMWGKSSNRLSIVIVTKHEAMWLSPDHFQQQQKMSRNFFNFFFFDFFYLFFSFLIPLYS